jgi:hypothetical protein
MRNIKKRLEQIREAIKKEDISYMDIVELQELKKYIDKKDVLLREWAGFKE